MLVGVGTVIQDDPRLTVRAVPGASPTRVVFDSTLRLPSTALVLADDAATIIFTTARSDPARRAQLRAAGVGVEVVADEGGRVDPRAALVQLRRAGMDVLLAEGGAGVITSLLRARLVDRVIVAVAPIIVGAGISAVDALGIDKINDGIHLANRSIIPIGDDVLLAWDLENKN